jgi:hypothetical protein
MAITSDSTYAAAKASGFGATWNKLSISAQVAGTFCSLWRANGNPAQAAIPGASVIVTRATLGALDFPAVSGANLKYLDVLDNTGTVQSVLHVWDRVLANGNFSGIVTTAQTTGQPTLPTRAPVGNQLRWFVECYTTLGATAAATSFATVTYDDNSTGNITVAIPASFAAGRLLPINSAVAGRTIKSVDSFTLSASTATAGAFGITCYQDTGLTHKTTVANVGEPRQLALINQIPVDACLALVVRCTTTSSGDQLGSAQIVEG